MKKYAEITTPLLPHQQRVIDKLKASGGVLAAHEVGSGKTLTSLAAKDQLGLPADAITPAPLVGNYEKELHKHFDKAPRDVRIRSYQRATRSGDVNEDALVTLDEAQRARNTGTQLAKNLLPQIAKAKARLLLTGTPIYNNPADLAPLINTAAGKRVLPLDREFEATYIGQEQVKPELLDRAQAWALSYPLGDSYRKVLTNKKDLVNKLTGYVDVHRNDGTHFPSRKDEQFNVPMSKAQMTAYSYASGDMPWYLRAKIESGLPLNKQEAKDLNAFQGALRQASNTARPYTASMTDDQEWESSPKLQMALQHLKEMRAQNPSHRGVIYSNYLDAGLNPLSRALAKENIPHNVFTGALTEAARKRMVEEYNTGKTPTLLLSGAGSEGLDLKGTRSIQLMEPHWNNSRLNQVIGRGIRYKSHEHLPAKDQNVRVMRYLSTLNPGLGGKILNAFRTKPSQSIEEYLTSAAADKDRVAEQLLQALQEASDRGPLKKEGEAVELGDVGRALIGRLPYGAVAGVTGAMAGGAGAWWHARQSGTPAEAKDIARAAARSGAVAAGVGTIVPAVADLYALHRATPVDYALRTWAQARDNQSRDLHTRNGVPFKDNAENATWIHDKIGPVYGTAAGGPKVAPARLAEPNRNIRHSLRPRFVVNVMSEQRDAGGRPSDVTIAGFIPKRRTPEEVDSWLRDVIGHHANAPGGPQTFAPDTIQALRQYLLSQKR